MSKTAERTKRITIVSGPFLPMPPAPCGAVERVWHGLAEEFVQRGHEVTVLCRAHPEQSADERIRGVRYVRRLQLRNSASLRWNLLKDFTYATWMLGLMPASDILVTNSFSFPVLAALRGRMAGKICVHVARVPKGQMWLYGRAARLQAVSGAIRDEIVLQSPEIGSKVKVFPNPIRNDVFTPPVDSLDGGGRGGGGRRTILYTGRIHPEKGLHLLIAALARLEPDRNRLRLRVVGPWELEQGGGGEDYLAELKSKARDLPVEFMPAIYDRVQLARVYQEASFYCYPTLAEKGEASPVAPLEAMSTGLVPVVSDLGCFRDYITDGQTGILFDYRAPDPVEALRAALNRLIRDPHVAAEMSARATAKAQEFSYAKVADLYLADFDELLRLRAR